MWISLFNLVSASIAHLRVILKIQVISKVYDPTKHIWSLGAEGFTIDEADRTDIGTDIIISQG